MLSAPTPAIQLELLEARYRELSSSYGGTVEWQRLAIATLAAIVGVQGEMTRLQDTASRHADGRAVSPRDCHERLKRLQMLLGLVETKLTDS